MSVARIGWPQSEQRSWTPCPPVTGGAREARVPAGDRTSPAAVTPGRGHAPARPPVARDKDGATATCHGTRTVSNLASRTSPGLRLLVVDVAPPQRRVRGSGL